MIHALARLRPSAKTVSDSSKGAFARKGSIKAPVSDDGGCFRLHYLGSKADIYADVVVPDTVMPISVQCSARGRLDCGVHDMSVIVSNCGGFVSVFRISSKL